MKTIQEQLEREPDKVSMSNFLQLAKKGPKGSPESTGVHKVKLLRGEPGTNKDFKTQKPVEGVHLFFDEDGVEKKYFVPQYVNDKNSDNYGKFHYLYERFAEIEEGTMLEMQYIKKGMAGYVEVKVIGGVAPVNSEEIPIIEEGQGTSGEEEYHEDNRSFEEKLHG